MYSTIVLIPSIQPYYRRLKEKLEAEDECCDETYLCTRITRLLNRHCSPVPDSVQGYMEDIDQHAIQFIRSIFQFYIDHHINPVSIVHLQAITKEGHVKITFS